MFTAGSALAVARWGRTVGHKLHVSFGFVALLAILAAAVGYVSVIRISDSVSVVADTTSPLLAESLRLFGDANRLRATVLSRTRRGISMAEAMRVVEEVHEDSQSRIASM